MSEDRSTFDYRTPSGQSEPRAQAVAAAFGQTEAEPSDLGDRMKQAATEPAADLLPDLRDIGDLHKQCSFPMRLDAIAASDTCRKHATSGVFADVSAPVYWRCSEHYGQVKPGRKGFVITHVTQSERSES